MPVRLGSRLPAENEARIEIIPLIDIMFFLLAAFMLVSLSMVNLKGVKVNLPTATTGSSDTARDLVNLSITAEGAVFLDQKPVADGELVRLLGAAHKTNSQLRIYLSGDRDVRHGEIMRVLDLVRSTGIERVAFEIREASPTKP